MSNFLEFKYAVQAQMVAMSVKNLFRTDVDKDDLWSTYLSSFPAGSDPIFRQRTEHDCSCCKQFIRACGNMVTVDENYQLVSIWDVEVNEPYQTVANALAELVKSAAIVDVFLHDQKTLGTDFNHEDTHDRVFKWEHFYFKLPKKFVEMKNRLSIMGSRRTDVEVFERGLEEINPGAVETVLELISQNTLYRGADFKATLNEFLVHMKAYAELDFDQKSPYCWLHAVGGITCKRIRNSVIGTLLVDLSTDMDLDQAVSKYESRTAPTNYKRPKALITQSMIKKAQQTVQELGLDDALQRRFATLDDITVNNVIFADREARKVIGGDVFDELSSEAVEQVHKYAKVDEVPIDLFIKDILPSAKSIELLLENRHEGNLVSLVAPVEAESRRLFLWDNNFSWSYKGEVADSIKERVKRAGGDVTGVLRCSLSWYNTDDLDIHVKEPDGYHIYYSNKYHNKTKGQLDVDMNAGYNLVKDPVENLTWPDKRYMLEGEYSVWVNQYCARQTNDVGFVVEIEAQGQIHRFEYDKRMATSNNTPVARFEYTHANGIELIESLQPATASREMWGLNTQQFYRVSMIMNSPNHWNDQALGNKHWFFVLDGCKNDQPVRGFYNEFIRGDLTQHRKVFEVLGSKLKAEPTDEQVSGLGFSITQRNSILCRVTGSFTRVIKVVF